MIRSGKERVLVLVAALFFLFGPAASAQLLKELEQEFIQLGREAGAVCVKVDVIRQIQARDLKTMGKQSSTQTKEVDMHSTLSGFLLDSEGHVATLGEALVGASRISTSLYVGDQLDSFKADLIGFDLDSNVGLLKIKEGPGIEPCRMGDSDRLDPGALLLSMGFIYNLGPSPSLSVGMVSATNRSFMFRHQKKGIENLIQSTLPIHPGETGGPVFNSSMEVVGLLLTPYRTSMQSDGSGTGFTLVLPINRIKTEVEKILGRVAAGDSPLARNVQAGPWLGFTAEEISDETLRQQLKLPEGGVFISYLFPDDPAASAGIRENDVLKSWNKVGIKGIEHLRELISGSRVGDQVMLLVVREGQEMEFSVSLGDY